MRAYSLFVFVCVCDKGLDRSGKLKLTREIQIPLTFSILVRERAGAVPHDRMLRDRVLLLQEHWYSASGGTTNAFLPDSIPLNLTFFFSPFSPYYPSLIGTLAFPFCAFRRRAAALLLTACGVAKSSLGCVHTNTRAQFTPCSAAVGGERLLHRCSMLTSS